MRIFYQLNPEEQDMAIQHCVDMIVSQAIENGLNLEVIDPNDQEEVELKAHIDALLEDVRNMTDIDVEKKEELLMSDDEFCSTVFDLANEMAGNAYYHQNDELVIFDDMIAVPVSAPETKDEPVEEAEMPKSKKDMLN